MNREEFLNGVSDWCNHRVLLWPALQATTGKVVEFGAGDGSTPFLRKYCEDNNREFLSFDNNKEWADKHNSTLVTDWDNLNIADIDVLLIDHAPGERRWIDIQKYSSIAKVIVIHDSEPEATGYLLSNIWKLFPFRINWESKGAWATMVSKHIDHKTLEDAQV